MSQPDPAPIEMFAHKSSFWKLILAMLFIAGSLTYFSRLYVDDRRGNFQVCLGCLNSPEPPYCRGEPLSVLPDMLQGIGIAFLFYYGQSGTFCLVVLFGVAIICLLVGRDTQGILLYLAAGAGCLFLFSSLYIFGDPSTLRGGGLFISKPGNSSVARELLFSFDRKNGAIPFLISWNLGLIFHAMRRPRLTIFAASVSFVLMAARLELLLLNGMERSGFSSAS